MDDPVTHFNVGLLMARTGRLDGAVAAYQRALERDPLLSDARSNLATTFARQGRIDRAVAELQRVLVDQPENLLARTNLGLLRLEQGRTAEAAREFEAALRVDPSFGPAAEALRSIGRDRANPLGLTRFYYAVLDRSGGRLYTSSSTWEICFRSAKRIRPRARLAAQSRRLCLN